MSLVSGDFRQVAGRLHTGDPQAPRPSEKSEVASHKESKMNVSVIGGGLVGTLEAILLANRGMQVDLYESRQDIRLMEHVPGRSINLALSVRGRAALGAVGLEDEVIKRHAIPMRARMIHGLDGSRRPIPYGKEGQCIYSVGRRFLNEVLLNSAEKHPNVSIKFSHKLLKCNLETGVLTFEGPKGEKVVRQNSDFVVGCDGAYSTVRREMMKRPCFNYSQTYIPHGYLELAIMPTADGKFAMKENYLHIWPRGQFMLIALPNQDRSFTVTLFMPFDIFESLKVPSKLVEFFHKHFPDALELIGKTKLVEDFFKNGPSPLVSVKCYPYHVGDRIPVVLLGDAAHAMVPFFGQGLNAGFEDTVILDSFLETFGKDLGKALSEYSKHRNPDAEAICDLAMYNYVEMRDLVNNFSFLLRKKVDGLLNRLFPESWVPLYSMVTFSRTRYHQCVKRRKWQDKILQRTGWLAGVTCTALMCSCLLRLTDIQWVSALITRFNQ